MAKQGLARTGQRKEADSVLLGVSPGLPDTWMPYPLLPESTLAWLQGPFSL